MSKYYIQLPQDEYGNTNYRSKMVIEAKVEPTEYPGLTFLVPTLPLNLPWKQFNSDFWVEVPEEWGRQNVMKEYDRSDVYSSHSEYKAMLRELGYDYPFMNRN